MNEGIEHTSNLLDWLYRDKEVEKVFSIESSFEKWIDVEIALAEAHFEKGIITSENLAAIRELHNLALPDLASFQASTRNVGYPIIGLLNFLNDQLPLEHKGVLHLGATTQDIMDTVLAMQVSLASKRVLALVDVIGDALAELVKVHALTLMPGRAHAQQAVPTTFGLKCAVYLTEISRHRIRLQRASSEAACVSLYGASGTSSAMGIHESEIRKIVSQKLGLHNEFTPWHVSRDRFIDLTSQCANLCVTLVRLAREIIDLSRSEIDEVYEPGGDYKGASSTMPQKRNPVISEAIIGLGLEAIGQAQMMFRAGEVGHERAAGEWQLEWKALPEVLINSAATTSLAGELLQGLGVNVERMKANVEIKNGVIMAEAYMIELAKVIGRERAHELVYEASKASAANAVPLHESLLALDSSVRGHFANWPMDPSSYVGNAEAVCDQALRQWKA